MTRSPKAMLFLLGILYGCSAPQVRQEAGTTVRVESQPPGAFVSYSPSNPYNEENAAGMGKTPLVRYLPLLDTGVSVQLTLRWYKPWTGTLSPLSPTINATLEPLTDAERQAAGWVTSAPIDRITIVPARIGTQKIGDAFQSNSPEFRNSFFTIFQQAMKNRFGQKLSATGAPALEGNSAVMDALEAAVKGIDMSRLATRATPLVIEFPAEIRRAVADLVFNCVS